MRKAYRTSLYRERLFFPTKWFKGIFKLALKQSDILKPSKITKEKIHIEKEFSMANNTPPRVPNRKSSNRKIYTSVAVIGLCTVLLSGAAGFAGSYFGNAASQPSQPAYKTSDNTANSSSNGSTSTAGYTVTDVSDVVARLRPSVVEITTESVSSGNSIFGQYTAQGAGSGVILSEDGYIVTNNHVVENADTITVKTFDGKEYPATLCGTDPQTDIAVIKIDAQGLSAATIGNSDDIKVGEATIAIGNPLGSLGGTVTTGIISAVGREITIENETMTLLQTDAAINPGNSGGGLFDANGNLIGIVNAKQSDTGIEGLGFAIPISDVTNVIDDLISNGKVTSRPVLNVSLQDITDSYFNYNSLDPGVYVVQIVPGGTADAGGVKYGDKIISFDGEEISSSSDVRNILKRHKIGDEVEIVVERDGQQQTLKLTLQGPAD